MRRWKREFLQADVNLGVSSIYAFMKEQDLNVTREVKLIGDAAAFGRERRTENDRRYMLIMLDIMKKEKRENEKKNSKTAKFAADIRNAFYSAGNRLRTGYRLKDRTLREEAAEQLLEQAKDRGTTDLNSLETLNIAKSGIQTGDDFAGDYYEAVCEGIRANGGVPDKDSYVSCAYAAITLKALGYDPQNVEGTDLLEMIDDYEKMSAEGIEGPVYAIVASNYCGHRWTMRPIICIL